MTKRVSGLIVMVFLAMGCSATAPISEPSSEPVSSDGSNLGKATLAGSLGSKGGEIIVSYSGTPKYRAVSFSGKKDELVNIWVQNAAPKGGTGHPLAWLRDKSFQLVAPADAGPDTEAHIKGALPHTGTYYVYFRDSQFAPASFRISLVKRQRSADPVLDAEAAYDVFLGDTDGSIAAQSYGLAPTELPDAARATYSAYDQKFGHPSAYFLDAGLSAYYAVADGVEEIWWVDMYDLDGNFLVHGSDGDSGPEIAYWTPQSWDPSQNP